MELILTDENREDIGAILKEDFDLDSGKKNDFQISVNSKAWDGSFRKKRYVYTPDGGFGGRIERIRVITANNEVKVIGTSWRGLLARRVVRAPKGAMHYTATGTFAAAVNKILQEKGIYGLFVAEDTADVLSINYQFDVVNNLLSGLEEMLKGHGKKLLLKYMSLQDAPGYMVITYDDIVDYSDEIEISQDNRLNFIIDDDSTGTNHLICLGKGEGTDRITLDLYADVNGKISQKQSLFGIDEIEEVYDYSNADLDTLKKNGTNKLKESMKGPSQTAEPTDDQDFGIEIGDIVSGRDYITGIQCKAQVTAKILKRKQGKMSVEYNIETVGE